MYCSNGAGGQFYPSEDRTHFPSIITHNKERDKEHDAQKPVSLIVDLIKHFSKEGDIILDPFLGSGTTAIAAKQLNRNYIGIEISPEYCKIAEQRLKSIPATLL